jgi:predicted transcriptional regulator
MDMLDLKKTQKNDMGTIFKQNDNTRKTRYYIIYEDDEFYHIGHKANNTTMENFSTKIPVALEGKLFEVVYE